MEQLTNYQKWLSKKYLAYQFFTSLFFVSAVWLYFYRLFITDTQVGILDAMAFTIGLLAEIPSGALADKFGRDRLVKAGQLFVAIGLIIQAFSSSFLPIFLGQSLMMIGVSFASGADEALFFDKLKFDKSTLNWRKLVTRGSQIALIGGLFATVAGGLLHELNPRLPWLFTGVSFIASVALIWSIKDSRTKREKTTFGAEFTEYLASIKSGISEFKSPRLSIYIPIILAIQGLFYANGYGLLRIVLLDRFTFTPFWGSVAVATSMLISIFILHMMHKHAERLKEKYVFLFVGLSAIAALLLSLADIGLWGYVVILVLYAGDIIIEPSMSESINNSTSEKQRATVLSIASFLRTLPYVLLALAIGYLNDNGQLEIFLIFWSALILFALFIYFRKRNI